MIWIKVRDIVQETGIKTIPMEKKCKKAKWLSENEAGQRLIRVLPREHTGHSKHSLPTTREDSTHGHHQMVNTEIRLIIFIAAKDGEALYSLQKQDQELTVAQIMNSLLPNSNSN